MQGLRHSPPKQPILVGAPEPRTSPSTIWNNAAAPSTELGIGPITAEWGSKTKPRTPILSPLKKQKEQEEQVCTCFRFIDDMDLKLSTLALELKGTFITCYLSGPIVPRFYFSFQLHGPSLPHLPFTHLLPSSIFTTRVSSLLYNDSQVLLPLGVCYSSTTLLYILHLREIILSLPLLLSSFIHPHKNELCDFVFSYSPEIFHCMYVPSFLYSAVCSWTLWLFSNFVTVNKCCSEQKSAGVFSEQNIWTLGVEAQKWNC